MQTSSSCDRLHAVREFALHYIADSLHAIAHAFDKVPQAGYMHV